MKLIENSNVGIIFKLAISFVQTCSGIMIYGMVNTINYKNSVSQMTNGKLPKLNNNNNNMACSVSRMSLCKIVRSSVILLLPLFNLCYQF
jgi:hypothetical protein